MRSLSLCAPAAGFLAPLTLNVTGAHAQTIDPFNPGANARVHAVAVQPDGKILVGGQFTAIGGGTGTTPRNYIVRLNADGSVDAGFNPGANSYVYAIAVQPDGKILVGGLFIGLGGGTGNAFVRRNIGRLNADGSVDPTFDPGANLGEIRSIVLHPDGRILVAGTFTALGGGTGTATPRAGIGRLDANGNVDPTFNPGASNGPVYTFAIQPDGMILIGGDFTGLGGGTGATPRLGIGRVDDLGVVDGTFNPGIFGVVTTMVVQPDGRILVGGPLTGIGGGTGTTPRSGIGRLNSDGSVDAFNPGAGGQVNTIALQTDGRILVGGPFIMLGGGGTGTTLRNRIGRLHADGTLDGSLQSRLDRRDLRPRPAAGRQHPDRRRLRRTGRRHRHDPAPASRTDRQHRRGPAESHRLGWRHDHLMAQNRNLAGNHARADGVLDRRPHLHRPGSGDADCRWVATHGRRAARRSEPPHSRPRLSWLGDLQRLLVHRRDQRPHFQPEHPRERRFLRGACGVAGVCHP